MGGAMIAGWTRGKKPIVSQDRLLIIDPSPGPDAKAFIDDGVPHKKHADTHIASAEYVLMAIKPQNFEGAGSDLAVCLPKNCVVISIMAGITMDRLADVFRKQKIVRAMPNTPASIGKGMTGYVCSDGLSKPQKKHVARLLGVCGETEELDNEALIDAVTAISGSGPAYFFHMVEALTGAGVSLGMTEDQAGRFARQTLIGAGALLERSGQSATELRRAVTSPGGTTPAALDVLMQENGLPQVLRDAVGAAYKRSQELGKD